MRIPRLAFLLVPTLTVVAPAPAQTPTGGVATDRAIRVAAGDRSESGFINTDAHAEASGAACQPEWVPAFGAMQTLGGPVVAMAAFDDGTGPALYAGGHFGLGTMGIARWDGSSWAPVGDGFTGVVHALAVFDDGTGPALYAGGGFNFTNNMNPSFIARWDGEAWSMLASDVNGTVLSLAVYDDGSGPALIAGGEFTSAGGAPAIGVAAWDGADWSPLGVGVLLNVDFPGRVLAIAVYDDGAGPALHVGGQFNYAGDSRANNIARWDGQSWTPLGEGISDASNPEVRSMIVFDDGSGRKLYVGGTFGAAGTVTATNIAAWDGAAWSPVGFGFDTHSFIGSRVSALAVFDDGSGPALHAAGVIRSTGEHSEIELNNIARWDGSEWSGLALGSHFEIASLSVFDDGAGASLYAGGLFTSIGTAPARYIGKWNGQAWSTVSPGFGGAVNSLAVFDDGTGPALHAGGRFISIDNLSINHIARRDGDAWSPLDMGLNSQVNAMEVFDDGTGPALYIAAESITAAGGLGGEVFAKWDGAGWTPLESGLNAPPKTLKVFDDGSGPALYAGGGFTTAGGVTALRIARWDGSAWSALGTGVSGNFGSLRVVSAITGFDDGTGPALYIGGSFTFADGVPVRNIARWDGSNWSSPGDGVVGIVNALAVFDDGNGPALYAGGEFNTAGGAPANNIARWNGSSWAPLAEGVNGSVLALTAFNDGTGDALYVGGWFTSAGGQPAAGIAKWDGFKWSPLSTGLDGSAAAFAVFNDGSGPALAVGGSFTASPAGDSFLAKHQGCAGVEPPAPSPDINSDGVVNGADLLILLNEFGGPGSADLNNDGTVNGTDLLILLNAFGTAG